MDSFANDVMRNLSSKKRIIFEEEKIFFGDCCWPRSVMTEFKVFG